MKRFAAVLVLALAAGPVHAAPLSQCAPVPGVNDKCESWNRPLTTAQSGAVGMVSRNGRVFVLGQGLRPDNGQPSMVVAAYTTKGGTLWTTRAPTPLLTVAKAITASHDGSRVYVTGFLEYRPNLNSFPFDIFYTMAMDGRTGRLLWVQQYVGNGLNVNRAFGIALSPNGDTVYVAGTVQRPCAVCQIPPMDWATTALKASTGTPKWVARYFGAASGNNAATAVAVSPSGKHVFVTGWSERPTLSTTSMFDWATQSYSAKTGDTEWTRRYTSTGNQDFPTGLTVSPGGDTVYVVGTAQDAAGGGNNTNRITAVAYSVRSGTPKWVGQYHAAAGLPSAVLGGVGALALSPGGDKLVVAGQAQQANSTLPGVADSAVATVVFNTKNGTVKWAALFAPGHEPGAGYAVAVSKNRVYVAGALGAPGLVAWNVTVGYDANSGTQQWVARYDTREPAAVGGNQPVGLATDGTSVFEAATLSPVTAVVGQGSGQAIVLGYAG